jgi:DNA-binding NtrC family response regulator
MAAERPTAPTILIVDDEDSTRNLCCDVITDSGLRTRTASTTEQALEILDQWPVEILITDLRVPQMGGLELLKRVRRDFPQTAVLVLTQYGTIESAVEATRLGAADYITKPFHIPELRSKIDRMIRMIDVDQENRILRETLRTRPGFGGQKEVRPVGSTERVPLQARIIAATNRDLEAAVRQGTFRQDLFFRLNVVQIKIPPLRERKTDIQPLVNSFLEKFSDPSGKMRTISEDGMARLMSYDWPGNVRELENAIERAIALGSGPILHAGDLPTSLQYRTNEQLPQNEELLPLEELERRAILRALREAGDDKLAAARILGIGKTTPYRKLKQYKSEAQPN